jgi:ATP-dependent DNA helicase RecG
VTEDEVIEHIEALRGAATDTANVEAKSSGMALPKSVRETLSSFSNTSGGGVLLLGVDEKSGFAVTGVHDAAKTQADLSSMCNEMVPAVRAVIGLHTIDGKAVISAEIPECSAAEKPCYYSGAGMNNGAYIRVGDADQRLTSYEVQMMLASRGRPIDDIAAVPQARISDLDAGLVASFCARVRARRPGAFGGLSDVDVLRLHRALVEHNGEMVPTVAGLLSLGAYPQQYFPNLNITFVHYPTPVAGEQGPDGKRFLDEAAFYGPVSELVVGIAYKLRTAMSKVAFGRGNFEEWDYPQEALRECIVNALVHRDLSPASQGAAVQVELFPDRLVVRNPGGLFGPVTVDQLGEHGVSSTRNEALVTILEDTLAGDTGNPICQNRGSGLVVMLAALREARMRPPQFNDRISIFDVAFSSHSLLSPDTVVWLAQFAEQELSGSQQTALAYARDGEVLTNAIYRRLTGVDSRDARQELADLTTRLILDQKGVRGGTVYVLAEKYTDPAPPPPPTPDPAAESVEAVTDGPTERGLRDVYDLLGSHAELSRREIETLLNISDKAASYRLTKLAGDGWVTTDSASRSPRTKYRRAR